MIHSSLKSKKKQLLKQMNLEHKTSRPESGASYQTSLEFYFLICNEGASHGCPALGFRGLNEITVRKYHITIEPSANRLIVMIHHIPNASLTGQQ